METWESDTTEWLNNEFHPTGVDYFWNCFNLHLWNNGKLSTVFYTTQIITSLGKTTAHKLWYSCDLSIMPKNHTIMNVKPEPSWGVLIIRPIGQCSCTHRSAFSLQLSCKVPETVSVWQKKMVPLHGCWSQCLLGITQSFQHILPRGETQEKSTDYGKHWLCLQAQCLALRHRPTSVPPQEELCWDGDIELWNNENDNICKSTQLSVTTSKMHQMKGR